jgi:hypothetical protein
MMEAADNGRMIALLIIPGLALLGVLAVRYGADSRQDRPGRQL